jgi:hypothetical protein
LRGGSRGGPPSRQTRRHLISRAGSNARERHLLGGRYNNRYVIRRRYIK